VNKSWQIVVQGDALAALVRYREKHMDEPVFPPAQPVPQNAEFERIRRAVAKRKRRSARRTMRD
jgi:hypothetical protein